MKLILSAGTALALIATPAQAQLLGGGGGMLGGGAVGGDLGGSLGGTLGESREVQAGVSSGDSVIVEAPPNLKDGDAVVARETGDG